MGVGYLEHVDSGKIRMCLVFTQVRETYYRSILEQLSSWWSNNQGLSIPRVILSYYLICKTHELISRAQNSIKLPLVNNLRKTLCVSYFEGTSEEGAGGKSAKVSKALVLISPKSDLPVEMLLAIMAILLNKLFYFP